MDYSLKRYTLKSVSEEHANHVYKPTRCNVVTILLLRHSLAATAANGVRGKEHHHHRGAFFATPRGACLSFLEKATEVASHTNPAMSFQHVPAHADSQCVCQ